MAPRTLQPVPLGFRVVVVGLGSTLGPSDPPACTLRFLGLGCGFRAWDECVQWALSPGLEQWVRAIGLGQMALSQVLLGREKMSKIGPPKEYLLRGVKMTREALKQTLPGLDQWPAGWAEPVGLAQRRGFPGLICRGVPIASSLVGCGWVGGGGCSGICLVRSFSTTDRP